MGCPSLFRPRWLVRSGPGLDRVPDGKRVEGLPDIVDAHDSRAAQHGRERRCNTAREPVADVATGDRPDRRLSRKPGKNGVAQRGDLVQMTQEFEIMRDRLAEAKAGVD